MENAPMIMVAPNGARRCKADHPALPITIAETIDTAIACYKAGANALHLHIRDSKGHHSLDSGLYKEALAELAQAVPDMLVQITTEAFGLYSVEQQRTCLKETEPQWASISVREVARNMNLADSVYGLCEHKAIKVQHILYDEADAQLLGNWLDQGIIRVSQGSVLLVLGRYTQEQNSNVDAIEPFLKALPKVSDWMLCAFGPQEHQCLLEAIKRSGNCRVGFENSLMNAKSEIWPDNQSSVAALVKAIHLLKQ